MSKQYNLEEIKLFLSQDMEKEFTLYSEMLNQTFTYRFEPSPILYDTLMVSYLPEPIVSDQSIPLGRVYLDTLRLPESRKSSESYRVLQYFLEVVNGHLPWPTTMRFTPTTPPIAIRCRVCGRKLIDPLSIKAGVGPICRVHEEKGGNQPCIIF